MLYVCDQCLPFTAADYPPCQDWLRSHSKHQLSSSAVNTCAHNECEATHTPPLFCVCLHIVHHYFLLHPPLCPLVHHSVIHHTHRLSIYLHPPPSLASLKGVALINYSVLAFRNLCPCEQRTHILMCVSYKPWPQRVTSSPHRFMSCCVFFLSSIFSHTFRLCDSVVFFSQMTGMLFLSKQN